jgi:sugar O-acyltransferase (sialic acid O-acetyltransferase NeuD family)
LVGAGGFGRELICWARDAEAAGRFPKISGYVDDTPFKLSGHGYEIPFLGSIKDFRPGEDQRLLLAVGDPNAKRDLAEMFLSRGAQFINLIHPTAVIASSAKLGTALIVCPHSLISADAVVGDFVTINTLSSVGHDVVVGKFTTLSAHVDVTGAVVVGERVFFGTGARTMPKITIGEGAVVGAGSLVLRSVEAGATMFAAAAKKL